MATTINTLTVEQLETLASEATVAGDQAMVELCERAKPYVEQSLSSYFSPPELDDSLAAAEQVVDAINDAEAMAD